MPGFGASAYRARRGLWSIFAIVFSVLVVIVCVMAFPYVAGPIVGVIAVGALALGIVQARS